MVKKTLIGPREARSGRRSTSVRYNAPSLLDLIVSAVDTNRSRKERDPDQTFPRAATAAPIELSKIKTK